MVYSGAKPAAKPGWWLGLAVLTSACGLQFGEAYPHYNMLVHVFGMPLNPSGMAKQMVEQASFTKSFKGSAFWMVSCGDCTNSCTASRDAYSACTSKSQWSSSCCTHH